MRTPSAQITWRVAAVIAWICLAAVAYFWLPLATRLWVLILPVWAIAWGAAGTLTLFVLWDLRHRRGALLVTIVLAGLATVSIATADWHTIFATTWFRTHQGQFEAAERWARPIFETRGSRPGWESPDAEDLVLDSTLSDIAQDGHIRVVGTCGGHPVLFVEAFSGIPDGALGWIHATCDQPPRRPDDDSGYADEEEYLDGNGDPLYAKIDLGGGWWWAD